MTRYASPTPRNQKAYPTKGAVAVVSALLAAILIGSLWAGYHDMIPVATEADQRPAATYRNKMDSLNRIYISEELIGFAYVDVDPETGVQTKIYVFPEAGIGFGVPRLDRDGSPMVGTVPGKELSE